MNASEIRLSRKAPWAPDASYGSKLYPGSVARNAGGSSLFAEVDGRYFRVSREHRDGLWDLDEIAADGEYLLRRDRSGSASPTRRSRRRTRASPPASGTTSSPGGRPRLPRRRPTARAPVRPPRDAAPASAMVTAPPADTTGRLRSTGRCGSTRRARHG